MMNQPGIFGVTHQTAGKLLITVDQNVPGVGKPKFRAAVSVRDTTYREYDVFSQ